MTHEHRGLDICNSCRMNIAKVNQAVKLKCQADSILNKVYKMYAEMTMDERREYSKRIQCNH